MLVVAARRTPRFGGVEQAIAAGQRPGALHRGNLRAGIRTSRLHNAYSIRRRPRPGARRLDATAVISGPAPRAPLTLRSGRRGCSVPYGIGRLLDLSDRDKLLSVRATWPVPSGGCGLRSRREANVDGQIHTQALTNYFEVARFVGLDPYEMLRRFRISPARSADPDAPAALGRGRRSARGQRGQVRLPELRPADGGVPDPVRTSARSACCSPTRARPATCSNAMVEYQSLLNEVISLDIEDAPDGEDGGLAIIRVGFFGGYDGRQSIELLMAIVCRTVSEVVSGRWHPGPRLFLPQRAGRPQPPYADLPVPAHLRRRFQRPGLLAGRARRAQSGGGIGHGPACETLSRHAGAGAGGRLGDRAGAALALSAAAGRAGRRWSSSAPISASTRARCNGSWSARAAASRCCSTRSGASWPCAILPAPRTASARSRR